MAKLSLCLSFIDLLEHQVLMKFSVKIVEAKIAEVVGLTITTTVEIKKSLEGLSGQRKEEKSGYTLSG